MVLGVGTWDRAGCPVPASGAFLTCSSLHNQVLLALSLCLAFHQFKNNPYLELPTSLTHIAKAIGLFHIHGHKDDCFARYAPTFILGAGIVDGEIIETLWEPLNPIVPLA